MQLERLRHPESGLRVEGDRDPVFCRHHDVGRVLPLLLHLPEEPVHQESAGSTSSQSRSHGNGKQFGAAGRAAGTVAKGLHHPAPGTKEATGASERSDSAIAKEERAIETADI
jgi:hypothetical protein